MITLLRRSLALATLAFWQGGFTFYAAIVVPIGAEVLGSHAEQGMITRVVTNYLNLAGAVALPILAWDIAASKNRARWRSRLRWSLLTALLVTLAGLAWVHSRLDAMIDIGHPYIGDPRSFRTEHQIYLLLSTLQWAAAVAYLVLSLWAWREEDMK